FLGIAGLDLLIIWPRFILLIIYINVLWFYYVLARNEEERMRSRYGEAYGESMQGVPMFIPGEPGRRLAQSLFGWFSGRKLSGRKLPGRKLRLFVLYCLSLAGAVGIAFALRNLSLTSTTHLTLPDEKVAAVSFLSGGATQLSELIESAKRDREIQTRLTQENGWTLVQALQGIRSATHVMIDAGMPVRQVRAFPLAGKGIKWVFLRREDKPADGNPFEARARWRPFLIAELDGKSVEHVINLPAKCFAGNPVMPTF